MAFSAQGTSRTVASAASDIAAKLAIVDDFYFGWGQTPRFQISPVMDPPDLCDHLLRYGYEQRSGGRVQVASLDDPRLVPEGHESADRSFERTSGVRVELLTRPDEEWYGMQRRVMGLDAAGSGKRRTLQERIPDPASFARCWVDDVPAAVGVAVLDLDLRLFGVFGMATAPESRRRGAASAILRSFASWARKQDATHAYLQVAPANEVALRVYSNLGFFDSHTYDYWVKPFAAVQPRFGSEDAASRDSGSKPQARAVRTQDTPRRSPPS